MKTLADLTGATGRPVDLHLMLDLVIPVHDGIQAQGDLIVLPMDDAVGHVTVRSGAAWHEVPPEGVELLRGGAGGNAHTLVADPGTCLWTADVDDTLGLALGAFEALDVAYLLHREHGGTGIAPGRYVVRRQREQGPPAPPRREVAGRPGSAPSGLTERRAGSRREEQRPRSRFVRD
jgi:hypothetical protein